MKLACDCDLATGLVPTSIIAAAAVSKALLKAARRAVSDGAS